MSFFESESTGRANQNIDEILRENMEATHSERIAREGSIGPNPGYWHGKDWGVTKEWMDDYARNLAMGTASAAPMHVLRRGVGRVATNIIRPRNYSIEDKISSLKHSNPKDIIKAIMKDKPLAKVMEEPAGYMPLEHRDLPYRLMFDLKPRHSGAYKKIPKSYETGGSPFNITRQVEFNPETVAGQQMLKPIGQQIGAIPVNHPVMGVYKQKAYRTGENSRSIDYEDLWDLGLNKGETKQLFERYLHRKGELGSRGAKTTDEISSYILRRLAESITNPVLIKGTKK